MQEPFPRASSVKWATKDGKTVGTLGAVRVVLRGPARIPPGLPKLDGFRLSDPGPIVSLYASDQDTATGKPLVEIHLTQSIKRGGRFGQFDEPQDRVAVVRVPSNRRLDSPLYDSTEQALEVALGFMHETFHVSLT
jgi:hypothetical protein